MNEPEFEKAEAKTETEAKPKPAPPAPVSVAGGALAPKDARELVKVIENIAGGGGFPERLDTTEKRIAAYNLAHSLMGPRWQLCLNNIAIIHGQMCIYGELPSALAEQTKEVAEKDVYYVDKDMNRICLENKNLDNAPYAGVCDIQRKGRAKKQFTYTIMEATAAGQYPATKWSKKENCRVPNPDSPWMKYTKIMLMRKAQALAIKFEFSDAMVGVPVAEYDFDELPEMKDVTGSATRMEESHGRAQDLNSRFAPGAAI